MLDVGGEPEFPASEVDNFVKATVAAATRGDITKSEAWQLKEKAKCVHYQQVSDGLGVSTCSWVLGDRPHLSPLDMAEIGIGGAKLLTGAVKGLMLSPRQALHQPSSKMYTPGRSVLTHPNPQGLLDTYAGTGQPVHGVRDRQGIGNELTFASRLGTVLIWTEPCYRQLKGSFIMTVRVGLISYLRDHRRSEVTC